MPQLLPDQTFYPSPTMAMSAPPETFAYIALLNPDPGGKDAMAVIDVDPGSNAYGSMTARVDMPGAGDELHHFGWNACSSASARTAPHPHMERRYLLVPGLRSSRIHILDTKPDPRRPRVVKMIEPAELTAKTGYSRPHTSHCGPDGIYVNALGAPDGDGPGGIFVLDPETFEIKGRVGARSRPAVPGLRLLVAPRPRHDDHQRVGHAEDGRGRRQSRAAARRQVRPRPARVGPAARRGTCRRSTSAPSTRWCSSCGPRTIRPRPTASSASSPAQGSVGVDLGLVPRRRHSGDPEGHRDPRRAGRRRRSCRRCSRDSARCRRSSPTSTSRWTIASCTCRAGAPASCSSTTSRDPFNPVETGSVRLGGIVARDGAPGVPGSAAERRAADGRGEPRRPARLRHATRSTRSWDDAVLPGRDPRLDGEAERRQPNGGLDARSRLLRSSSDDMRPHQVRLEGGDASLRLVLLLVGAGHGRRLLVEHG